MSERLTLADIAGRKGINPMHIDYSRSRSAWIYECEGVPRLKMWRMTERGVTTQSYTVDSIAMPNLETALAVINGDMTIEEVGRFDMPAKRPKLSLTAQIAEIDYELKQRANVYPRLSGKSPGRQSELEQHVESLKAVRATLVWLQEHEPHIKQRMSY